MNNNVAPTFQEFCSGCGSLLPLPEVAPCSIKCVLCKQEKRFEANNKLLINREVRSYVTDLEDTADIDEEEMQVEHPCSKCTYGYAAFTTQQTRSADEGQTVFYTCLKCRHKDIEYS